MDSTATRELPSQRVPPQTSGSIEATWDLLTLVAGLLISVDVNLLGVLHGTEVIFLAMLPLLFAYRPVRLVRSPVLVTLLLLMAGWLLSQVITDVIRPIPVEDYARGWARVVLTATNLTAMWLLFSDSSQRIRLFALGIAFGGPIGVFLSPSRLQALAPWKMGVGMYLIIGFLVLATYRRRPVLGGFWVLALLAIGFASILADSRSLGGLVILTALYSLLPRWFGGRKPRPLPGGRLLLFAFFALVSVFSILAVYDYVATQGWLGEPARARYEQQAFGVFGIILGGRREAYAAIHAIMDSPIIGHGSWAKNIEYARMLSDLERYGYSGVEFHKDYIPSHSHLLGAWVDAGFLGAIFWFWVLALAIRSLAGLYTVRHWSVPLIAFCGFHLLWDVLFSPYTGDRRVLAPFFVILLVIGREYLLVSKRRNAIPRGHPLANRLTDTRAHRAVPQPVGDRVDREPG